MQIIVNSLLTTYSRVGNGKNIILFLHGWADSGKTFDDLAEQIIKGDSKYSAILLDLPGFGGSSASKDAWGLSDYAAFVADFMAKTKLQPQIIVGHSNGGAIAIHGLANNIFTAEKLILIASAGIRQKSAKKTLLRGLAAPAKVALKATPSTAQKRIKKKFYSAIGSDYLIAEHMQETFKKIVSQDVRLDAAKLTIPVCLIYGEDDSSTPPQYGEILASAIRGSGLNVIPLAGHFVHQEQLSKVTQICNTFIGEIKQ